MRRFPLALLLLRCNYASQADGLEVWWLNGGSAASDAEVDEKITAARTKGDDDFDFGDADDDDAHDGA